MMWSLFLVAAFAAEPDTEVNALRDAEALSTRADEHNLQGRPDAARPLLEESLAIWREHLEPDDATIAIALTRLAIVSQDLGDFAAAEAGFEEALGLVKERFGPRHVHVASALNNLAVLHQEMGNEANALPLMTESLEIYRETLDPDHPEVATSMANLAAFLRAQGDISAARELLEESVEISREALPAGHPDIAFHLSNLAMVVDLDGDEARAVALLEESLSIFREALGPSHPEVATTLKLLASVHRAHGNRDLARGHIDEALALMEGRLVLLDALSAREAIQFIPVLRPILDEWLVTFDRPEDAESAWRHVMLFKGLVGARSRSLRALGSVESEFADLAFELDTLRQQLAQLAFAGGEPAELARVSTERDRVERDLVSRSAHHRRDSRHREAGRRAICEALPEESVIVDFLRYGGRNGRYLAFVMSSDCALVRVDLGSAAALESAVAGWQEVLRDPNGVPERLKNRSEALTAAVWEPLAADAGDYHHWLVVPDGPLATFPFGALPIDGGYAIEAHLFTHLDRAADVLVEMADQGGVGALVVGGVDYDVGGASDGGTPGVPAPCNGRDYVALPGTEVEIDNLSSRWTRWRRREPLAILGGGRATESQVAAALEGKALVHIATHGFFASGDCQSAVADGRDPMLLSGLVLAGANRPPDSSSSEDGILTATEVAICDLSETGLVVLSACETGLGEIQSGEGVLGLRRAFAIAGAKTLVMSLWSVSDDETATLMDGMYSRYLKRRGMPAAAALRQAQLEVLANQRESGVDHPFAWAAFIASGDWRL